MASKIRKNQESNREYVFGYIQHTNGINRRIREKFRINKELSFFHNDAIVEINEWDNIDDSDDKAMGKEYGVNKLKEKFT